MSARYATCARCRRPERQVAKIFPDGPLCASCRAQAVRHRGRCADCKEERLLPGAGRDGARLCCSCAGIDENYTCSRCGTEWALRRGICEWCHLADVLDTLMDGEVDLSALRQRLLDTARPESCIIWLYQSHVQELLHGLSTGVIPLSHEGLDDYAHRQAADHLRDLLTRSKLLVVRSPRPPKVPSPRRATCTRCMRPDLLVAKNFPDGSLCKRCHSEAVRRRGRCDRCGQERLLPGVDSAGGRLCCSCAGIDENYTCSRCGTEWALRRGICEWCHLADVLDTLMDGEVDLSALRERLLRAARPDSLIIWLMGTHVKVLLHELGVGKIPLTHEGLDDYVHRTASDHLRGLLLAVGLLPGRDERLAHFDRWVSEHLADIAPTLEDLGLLTLFATWELRRRLVSRSDRAPLRDEQVNAATQNLRVAAELLAWLHQRGSDLSFCAQSDLDEWFATPPSTHAHARAFVRWATATHRCPKLVLAPRRHQSAPVLDQGARLNVLARLLDPSAGRLVHRVAAMFLVLLAQPFNRIAALKVDDVIVDGAEVGISLGQGVTPIPVPFAAMVCQLLAQRPNLNTAANPSSPWLFPGRVADNHVRPSTLRSGAMAMGINLMAARSAALRQLVLDCPPAVVADMLGYSYQAIDRHAVRAGSRWSSYAALRAQ